MGAWVLLHKTNSIQKIQSPQELQDLRSVSNPRLGPEQRNLPHKIPRIALCWLIPRSWNKYYCRICRRMELLLGASFYASCGSVIDARLAVQSRGEGGTPDVSRVRTRFANPLSHEVPARCVCSLFSNGLGIPLLPRKYWTHEVPCTIADGETNHVATQSPQRPTSPNPHQIPKPE